MFSPSKRFANWSRATLAALVAFAGINAANARNWKEGDSAPQLSEYGLEGNIPTLKGKVTLIDFWASWCVPCKASFPAMEGIYQDFNDKGFQIVAINLDSDSKPMERFLKRQAPSFSIVRDAQQNTVKAAGIDVFPTSFLVDRNGVIRYVHEGWHGRKSREEIVNEINTLLSE